MRTSIFLFLLCGMVCISLWQLSSPETNRESNLQKLKPGISRINSFLPAHSHIGLVSSGIPDDELIHQVRWLMYPRIVEGTHLQPTSLQDTLLVIYNPPGKDSFMKSFLDNSLLLYQTIDSGCFYAIVVPTKSS